MTIETTPRAKRVARIGMYTSYSPWLGHNASEVQERGIVVEDATSRSLRAFVALDAQAGDVALRGVAEALVGYEFFEYMGLPETAIGVRHLGDDVVLDRYDLHHFDSRERLLEVYLSIKADPRYVGRILESRAMAPPQSAPRVLEAGQYAATTVPRGADFHSWERGVVVFEQGQPQYFSMNGVEREQDLPEDQESMSRLVALLREADQIRPVRSVKDQSEPIDSTVRTVQTQELSDTQQRFLFRKLYK